MYLSQCLNNLCWDVIIFTAKARSWPLCFLKRNGIGKQNRWILLSNLMFVIKKKQWISPLKEKFNDLNIYINLYINILIPNVAEKNILIFLNIYQNRNCRVNNINKHRPTKMYLSQCLNNLCWDVIIFTAKARSWPLCFLKRNGIGKQNRWILLSNLMFVIKKTQWISPLKEKFNDLNIYINLYINILIPNVAEKNILIFLNIYQNRNCRVNNINKHRPTKMYLSQCLNNLCCGAGKKKSDSEFLSYKLMLYSGGKKYSNFRVVRKSNKNLWRRYLWQWASNIKSPSKRNGLLQIVHHFHLIEIECNLIAPWCNWETSYLV